MGPTDNKPTLVQIMAPNRRQPNIWTNGGIVHWRIYTSLGLDELSFTNKHVYIARASIMIEKCLFAVAQ